MQFYLIFMAVRLLEIQRIVKPTGSVYLHCDPTASHYLKLLMDGIFGLENFQNEIIWPYRRWPSKQQRFQRMHDVLLFYIGGGGHRFNVLFEPPSKATLARFKGQKVLQDPITNSRKLTTGEKTKGTPQRDVWNIGIIAGFAKERTGYPTQKPIALLDRVVQASSNPGDMVLDPFCGCATTLVAADRLGRRWAGIDLSPLAIQLVNDRIAEDRAPKGRGREVGGSLFRANALEKPPTRTDLGRLPNYRTHRHRLYGEQEGVCAGCDTHFPFRVMDVDHMLPRRQGGTDHPDKRRNRAEFQTDTLPSVRLS